MFVQSLVLQVGCVIKFTATSAVIDWNLWTIGSIGSLVSCLGQVFATSAIGTGKPAGPMSALFSSQVIIVTLYSAIRQLKLPHYMQLIGLAFGIIGALIISVPEQMHSCWLALTC